MLTNYFQVRIFRLRQLDRISSERNEVGAWRDWTRSIEDGVPNTLRELYEGKVGNNEITCGNTYSSPLHARAFSDANSITAFSAVVSLSLSLSDSPLPIFDGIQKRQVQSGATAGCDLWQRRNNLLVAGPETPACGKTDAIV